MDLSLKPLFKKGSFRTVQRILNIYYQRIQAVNNIVYYWIIVIL